MAISRESMPKEDNRSGSMTSEALKKPRSSRPTGVASNPPSSRPTGVASPCSSDYNSSEDEMKYGRIVKIIKAEIKNEGG